LPTRKEKLEGGIQMDFEARSKMDLVLTREKLANPRMGELLLSMN
jgi:hypothetical protein